MSELFLHIFNMSIAASFLLLAVLLFRVLFKKAPKWINVLLWGIVAVRLICPFTIESALSLIPSAQTVSPDIMMDATPKINSGIPILNAVINPVISGSFAPDPATSANPLQILIPVLSIAWIAGIAGMLLYTVISHFHVKSKIGTAVLLRDNIFQSEHIVSPFVFGIVKPKIYLPYRITNQEMPYVLAHEQAHIHRKDHIWKPLGFLVLTLHWFNPLVWLGYILFCRDIELACDQKVIAALDRGQRADYSQALLACSVKKHRFAACPPAFSEVGVKTRVASVLQYKKPALGVILAAVAVSLALAIGFLTSPLSSESIGIQSLSAKRLLSNKIELNIRYSHPTGGYSVRALSENEGKYCGDGMRSYDGALGKYRIMIKFGDTDPSEAFTRNFPIGDVVEIKNAPINIRAKRVSPEDHGFVLYLGFDTPIQIEETDYTMLNALGGTLRIQLEEE
ncbi:MAG: hypothetical protein IJX08_00575 [Clostridia bacterium]|nr:hypothetical protein [Clostridia bacterium]